ncbi:MAG: hypothetical protein AB7H88_20690 [Vicinamibacterales bacterium]
MPAARPTFHPSERPVVAFVAVFVLLVGGTVAAWLALPGFAGEVKHIQLAYRPPGGDYYLAHDHGGHVDHHVLYFGTDEEAVARLKAADVLFLGNSRLMFALRSRTLAPFFEARGLSYYVLGFGFREGDRFPLEIIRRFDLHPRLVVVNADGFFGAGLSPWGRRVVRDTPFGAWKRQVEAEAGHEARRVVHQVIPNWIDLYGRPGFEVGREFIAYRSRTDGSWFVSPWPDPVMAVPDTRLDVRIGPRVADAARAFQAEMAARGARVVLTFVPTPAPQGDFAGTISRLLEVPLVAPDVEGLTSHDGSHLSEGSAVAWSQVFLEALAPYLPPPAGPPEP